MNRIRTLLRSPAHRAMLGVRIERRLQHMVRKMSGSRRARFLTTALALFLLAFLVWMTVMIVIDTPSLPQ